MQRGGKVPSPTERSVSKNGHWYREVVQRREGLRIHRAGQRWSGRILPSHRHRGGRLSHARRGAEGAVRSEQGAEGPAGCERPPDRLNSDWDGVDGPGLSQRPGSSFRGALSHGGADAAKVEQATERDLAPP